MSRRSLLLWLGGGMVLAVTLCCASSFAGIWLIRPPAWLRPGETPEALFTRVKDEPRLPDKTKPIPTFVGGVVGDTPHVGEGSPDSVVIIISPPEWTTPHRIYARFERPLAGRLPAAFLERARAMKLGDPVRVKGVVSGVRGDTSVFVDAAELLP